MPPTASRRSGIPRLGSLKVAHTSEAPATSRKPRKSSSSDAENEFTNSSKSAQARVSRPMKMQGPFRPSIVGRVAKKSEWLAGKKTTRSISRDNVPARRRNSEEDKSSRGKKSKSSSPPERRPLKETNILNPGPNVQQQLHTEKEKVRNLEKHLHTLDLNKDMKELQKENKMLQNKVGCFQKEVADCKRALDKCHIDPVTLEPLKFEDNIMQSEKLITKEELDETKKALEHILSQNRTMLESLKDLMESV